MITTKQFSGKLVTVESLPDSPACPFCQAELVREVYTPHGKTRLLCFGCTRQVSGIDTEECLDMLAVLHDDWTITKAFDMELELTRQEFNTGRVLGIYIPRMC